MSNVIKGKKKTRGVEGLIDSLIKLSNIHCYIDILFRTEKRVIFYDDIKPDLLVYAHKNNFSDTSKKYQTYLKKRLCDYNIELIIEKPADNFYGGSFNPKRYRDFTKIKTRLYSKDTISQINHLIKSGLTLNESIEV